ncbi:PREDICTED: uncharacterized protein LOC104590504 [Nelumbo nucifera]|uniref:Uncharacterized protein LOC104590504 n=1 Tax=Nelumbo nucifera TaxID=4432 RepID=A0A1U7ZIG3_NELNU|nr:PREDICTED: uncharacterized protein LOC104590504 [Nelumbo nucifera]
MLIKQKQRESLQSYIDRFKKEELEVHDLDPMVSMHAAINGLCTGSALKCSVAKILPKTKLEFLKKAQKYIAAEEASTMGHQEREVEHHNGPPKKKRKGGDNPHPNNNNGNDNKKPPASALAYKEQTPLNSTCAQKLMQIGEEKYVKWPEKLKRNPRRGNSKKYCKYHRSTRHDTEDCYDLKNEIVSLILCGHLK